MYVQINTLFLYNKLIDGTLRNVYTRTLSGSIYVALIVLAILLTAYTQALFLLLFSFIIAVGIWELYHLTADDEVKSTFIAIVDIVGGVALFFSFYLMYLDEDSITLWMIPTLVYIIVRISVQLFFPHLNAIKSFERSIFGIFYVAMPIALLNSICAIVNARMLLAIFIFIWLYDSGAFAIGCTFGKHRLFERISPKKSWEGFFGGLFLCFALSFAFFYFFNDFFSGPNLITWIGLGIIIPVFSNFGDLFESLIKRTIGVKDSGNLIPGHGGMLDRIDSLLLVSPAVLLYFILMINN